MDGATDIVGLAYAALGGDTRSHMFEARRQDILVFWEARKEITLEELRLALLEV